MLLLPSGMAWLDSEIGGLPAAGVTAVVGEAGSGKTTLALGFALASLERGRTCVVTNDSPDTLLETSLELFERDLRPAVESGDLTILSFAPFFGSKMRSLASVDGPLAELGELVAERRVQNVVFDTLDPMLAWVDRANAPSLARSILSTLQSWGVPVLCTMSGAEPMVDLARGASGWLELTERELLIHHARWCDVQDRAAPVHLVQGRGLVVRTTTPPPPPAEEAADPDACSSLIGDSMQLLRLDHAAWQELWDDIASGGPSAEGAPREGAEESAAGAIAPLGGRDEGEPERLTAG